MKSAILEKPKVLLVNLGGGISAQVAKYQDAEDITVFEQNPEIVRLITRNPAINFFTGDFFSDPQVPLAGGEGQFYLVAYRRAGQEEGLGSTSAGLARAASSCP